MLGTGDLQAEGCVPLLVQTETLGSQLIIWLRAMVGHSAAGIDKYESIDQKLHMSSFLLGEKVWLGA